MINIMVDVDGVLVDWLGKFKEIYNGKIKEKELDFLEPMGVLVDYNVKADINELNQTLVEEVLEEIDAKKGEVNLELVAHLVELNKRDGVNVEVVTARTRHLDHTYKLMRELGFDEGHIILGMKHKEDIHHKYDIIIDDSPFLAEKLINLDVGHKVFMPKWSYNWHMRDKVSVYGDTDRLIEAIDELTLIKKEEKKNQFIGASKEEIYD